MACTQGPSAASVKAAMGQYDHLIKKMDADSIALLFTKDGDLGTMAHGRDSIRSFLSAFKNVQVLAQVSAIGFLKLQTDTALLKGTYWQTDLVDHKDTIHLKGNYIANWVWVKNDGWHLQKITTIPSR
jgi:hypothetical protein